jgi:hypothetical protein
MTGNIDVFLVGGISQFEPLELNRLLLIPVALPRSAFVRGLFYHFER